MKGLRTYWRDIKNKMIGVSGQAAKKQPQWVWFESLNFLNQYGCSSSKTTEKNTSDESIESSGRPKYGKRKKPDDQQVRHNDLLEKLVDSVEKEFTPAAPPQPAPELPDEDKQFGAMIATRLSKMPECDQKDQVKLKILQSLMECASD